VAWTVRIERPPEEVFDYVADLEHQPEWVTEVSSVVRTTSGEIGVDTTWKEPAIQGVKTIDHYERPHEVSFQGSSHLMVDRAHFSFVPVGDGATEVSAVEEWRSTTRVGRLSVLLAGFWLRRKIQSDRGPRLKEAIERT